MAKRAQSTFERLRGGNWSRQQRREIARQLSKEDPGWEILHPDAAGIDVGSESHYVSVPPDRDANPVQEFGSWTSELERMAEWLISRNIKTVVMQSTGVYWIALYEVLERHGLEVYLVNARNTRSLPGRKSDVQECQWLRRLHTYGLLANSFRPAAEIRRVRTIWRLRGRHVQDAARCIHQIQKALTTMNVRLEQAVSDISGLTGLKIIRAILKGERDRYVLADLRDPRVKASREEIAHCLEGHWSEDVLFELQQAVEAYDFVQKQIADCDGKLEQFMALLPSRANPAEGEAATGAGEQPSAGKGRKGARPKSSQPQFDLRSQLVRVNGVDLTAIEGIDVMGAETILSEIGPDVSKWESEKHLASWAGLAPNREVSGGKVIRHTRQPNHNRVGLALRMAANSLHRSQSYLGARFRKLKARLGAPKAIKAMARHLCCLVYRLLKHGQAWVDQGAKAFEEKHRQREIAELQRRASALGYYVSSAE